MKGLRTYIMSIRVKYTILCFARQNSKSLHEAAIETDSLSSGRNSNGEFKYISFVPVIVKSFFFLRNSTSNKENRRNLTCSMMMVVLLLTLI